MSGVDVRAERHGTLLVHFWDCYRPGCNFATGAADRDAVVSSATRHLEHSHHVLERAHQR